MARGRPTHSSNAPLKAPAFLEIGTWLLSQCQWNALKNGRALTNIERLTAADFHGLRLIVFSHLPEDGGRVFLVAPRAYQARMFASSTKSLYVMALPGGEVRRSEAT